MGLRKFISACTRRKPLAVSSDTNTSLERCLSTLDLTFIGIGSTLGAGIYVLTGQVAKNKAGPAVVLSFFIAALASILSGLCYAEFGARFPKAGSAYVYCYVSIGEFCAFFIGWNVLMEYIIGGSAIAKGASSYIDSLAKGFLQNSTVAVLGEIHVPGLSHYFDVFSVLIVVVFTIILALGVKNSSRLNNFLVVLNILTILVVTIVGFMHADPKNWTSFAPFGFRGIIQGASTCFFAFIGFDIIATTCEEAKNPGKSIPFSILGTITVCFIAYICVSSAITLMVPYYDLDPNAAVSTAFGQRGLHFMVYIIGMGATISLLGCTLVTLIAPPRLLYAMAKDGLIPSIFASVNEKTNIPLFGTITAGVLIALMAAILDLDSLVEMLSIGTLLAYSIVDISVLMLRYRKPDEKQTEESSSSRSDSDMTNSDMPSNDTSFFGRLSMFRTSQFAINITIFCVILEILALCLLLDKFSEKLFIQKDGLSIVFLFILCFFILGNGIFLSRIKTDTDNLPFKVPGVPWIPMIALGFNFSLMLELSYLTWVRFGVWMIIGIFVYFGYSMHHSVEEGNAIGRGYDSLPETYFSDEDEKTPLAPKDGKYD